ncbi:hypothetical protein ALT_9535 [Aspergillus lentulus]|uniref:Uncharacterized protein n=1 Tax=Aspergillus lentulus TaxID=293939 RepID=A0AAN4TFM2_ASPLE|nr:hypothetical protein ALT_9535 [Aspergillus lentulus]
MRRSRMTGNSQDKRDKGPKNLRQCSHPDIVRDRLLRSRLNRGQVISGGSMIAHSFSMVCEHLDRFVVGVSMVLPVDPHESWKRTEASLEASSASVERKSSQGFKGTRFDDFVLKFIPDGDQVPVPPRKEEEHDEYKDVYDDGLDAMHIRHRHNIVEPLEAVRARLDGHNACRWMVELEIYDSSAWNGLQIMEDQDPEGVQACVLQIVKTRPPSASLVRNGSQKGATVGLDGGKDEVVNNMGTGDQAVLEEGAVVDTDGAGVVVASAVVSKASDDESNFEDALEGESSASEAQLQPIPERQRQIIRNKPFRNEEEDRDVAEGEDVPVAAERQRLRRGRRGEQTLIQSNTIDNAGRTVGQSSELVLNRTDGVVGTITDTSGRVLGRPSEKNEQLKKEDDEQLRLRLDLNLDLEVQLKAKISGDLTLTLLLVSAPAHNEFGYSLLTE